MNEEPKALDQAEAELPALDLDSVFFIHRDNNGFIVLGRKPDPANPQLDKRTGTPKAWETLGAVRPAELRSYLPGIAEWLAKDSYFSVNAFYRPAPYRLESTGLPGAVRKEKDLYAFNAFYADIDCGRPGSAEPGATLESIDAQARVGRLALAGVIPHPSMIAHSGRGLYALWILRDEKDPSLPPRAWPELRNYYKLCNKELNTRLRTHLLPADRAAVDAARVIRFPGSIHRKTGRRVTFSIDFDQAGRPFLYTLAEMVSFLGISTAPSVELPPATRSLAKPAQYRRVKRPGSAPLRSAGPQKLAALRARDLVTIGNWRRGFKKRGEKYEDGTTSPGRRRILTIYACFLRSTKVCTPEDAITALRAMAAQMQPPYPSDGPGEDPPIETIVREEYAGIKRSWSNEKLCALLGITAEAARELELQTIRPLAVTREADQARPLRTDIAKDRQEWARDLIVNRLHGRVPSSRRLAALYREADFPGANKQTANADLNALGFFVNRSSGGRPRKTYKGGK